MTHRHSEPELNTAHDLIQHRLKCMDWQAVTASLNDLGWASLKGLLLPQQCVEIAGLYGEQTHFRSRIIMARHHFGRGEYQYFHYPLPDLVAELRRQLFPHLAKIANRWQDALGTQTYFPTDHQQFIQQCHTAGQTRPTPLLLKYAINDYNCLHQDIYGEQIFPLQIAILLSQPNQDFTGGEFVLTEQRPRMQSRPHVVPLQQGDAVIFAVHERPVKGVKGYYRVKMRHGVSRILSGNRYTLGIIFHDAT
ncbi:2OG-Fe(II) oxygenase [Aquirhabdus sp.]|uniref:2OG-Fe(II) oxygenase n=1 Tax=Aquirhabdus sp. TaxID=2824160 RepID=UPI00396CC157